MANSYEEVRAQNQKKYGNSTDMNDYDQVRKLNALRYGSAVDIDYLNQYLRDHYDYWSGYGSGGDPRDHRLAERRESIDAWLEGSLADGTIDQKYYDDIIKALNDADSYVGLYQGQRDLGSYLSDWEAWYNGSVDALNGMDWSTGRDGSAVLVDGVTSFTERDKAAREWLETYKDQLGDEYYNSVLDYLNGFGGMTDELRSAYDQNAEYFGRWGTQEEFDQYQRQVGMDLEAEEANIAELRQAFDDLDEINQYRTAGYGSVPEGERDALKAYHDQRYEEIVGKYGTGSTYDLIDQISQMEEEVRKARRVQEERAQVDQVRGWEQQYGGMTYTELNAAIEQATDPVEKMWLQQKAPTVMTDADYAAELEELDASIVTLGNYINVLKARNAELGSLDWAVLQQGTEEQSRSYSTLHDEWDMVQKQLRQAEQEYDAMMTRKLQLEKDRKYTGLTDRDDFEENSVATATERTNGVGISIGRNWRLGKGDAVYDYINFLDGSPEDHEERNEGDGRSAYYIYDRMTDDERQRYNYLYNTEGRASADDYLRYLQPVLDRRASTEASELMTQFADTHPLLADAANVPLTLAGGLGYLDLVGQKTIRNITGSYEPINYYSPMMNLAHESRAISQTRVRNITDKYGVIHIDPEKNPAFAKILNGRGLADVYQLGMSAINSKVAAMTGNPVAATLLLASSAATQGVLDALDRGATDDQALQMGMWNGLFEAIFEFIEVENLLKGDDNWIRAILNQAITEGLGEGFTSIANNIADVIVMADKSEIMKAAAEYRGSGMDKDQALWNAIADAAIAVGWDIVGGAASGAMSVGGIAVTNTINQRMQYNEFPADMKASVKRLEGYGIDRNEAARISSILYERGSDYGKNANAFILGYVPGQDVAQYSVDFKTAYEIGKNEGNKEYIGKLSLTKAQGEVAYRLGIQDRNKAAKVEEERPDVDTDYVVSKDGQTVDTQSGEEIEVTGFKTVGKNAELETKNGSIKAENVSFATEDEAVLYEVVGRTIGTANMANNVLQAYKQAAKDGMSASDFAAGLQQAYDLGFKGQVAERQLGTYELAGALPVGVRSAAFNQGKRMGDIRAASRDADIRKQGRQAQGKREGRFHFDRKGRTFDSRRESSLTAMEALSKALGIDIYVYESYKEDGKRVYQDRDGKVKKAPNGFYDAQGIHIDLNAGNFGQGTMMFTVAHELTHFIKEWSPVKFRKLADLLVERYAEQGTSVRELIDRQIVKAKENGRTIDRDTAFEEVVADSMETMLTQGDIGRFMAELKQQDKTLRQKVADWFKDLAQKLQAVVDSYKGVSPESPEGRLVAQMDDFIGVLQQAYAEALVDAGENYRANEGNKKTTQEGGRKSDRYELASGETIANTDRFYTWDFLTSLAPMKIAYLPEVTAIRGADNHIDTDLVVKLGMKNAQIRGTVIEDKVYVTNRYTGKKIRIDHESIRHGLDGDYKRLLTNSRFGAIIGDVVQNAVPINGRTDTAKNVLGTYSMVIYATDSRGREFVGMINVEERTGTIASLEYYDVAHSVSARQKKGSQLDTKSQGVYPIKAATISIEDFLEIVKQTHQSLLPQSVLNHFEEQRNPKGDFSDSVLHSDRDAGAEKVVQALEKQNAKLKEDVKDLRELLRMQGKLTHGQEFKKSSIDAAVRGLAKEAMATLDAEDRKQLHEMLKDFYKYIAADKDLAWDGVMEKAGQIADFLQARVNMRESDDRNAMEYAYNHEAIRQGLMLAVYDSYWRVDNLTTVADKKQKEIHEIRTNHRKRMDTLKEDYRKTIQDLEDKRRKDVAAVRKEYREKNEKQIEKMREQYKESRDRAADIRKKADMRSRICKVIRELDKLFSRGDKKRNVKEEMRDLAATVLASAEVIFTDNYSENDMIRDGVTIDLSERESRLLNEAMDILAQLDNPPADPAGIEAWYEQEEKLKQRLSRIKYQLREVFEKQRNKINGTTVKELLQQLANSYADLMQSEESYIRDAFDENVYEHLLTIMEGLGYAKVKDMRLDQMEALYDAYKMVLTTIRNANKLFDESIKETKQELAEKVMIEESLAAKRKPKTKAGVTVSKFMWNNLKPVYAFERIGSETLSKLYGNIRKGQDSWAIDMREANEFRKGIQEKYNFDSWDMDEVHTFKTNSGADFDLTLSQLMSIYAYSKREQAYDHMMKGGFVFDDNTTTTVTKMGIPIEMLNEDASTYKVSMDTLSQIIGALTQEQAKFVDEMQEYLSATMGDKGNSVSMKLYGIKLFNEKNYFPLKSAGQYMAKAKEADLKKEQGQISIASSGFTKNVAPKASNPIILSGFMDVWAGHVNDMSMYHSFVLPMEDFRKVYNYSTPNNAEDASASVNAAIQNAHGRAATAYIDQLYRDLNGGALTDSREGLAKSLVGKFKKAAVMASLSVVFQQPSAIGRAFSEVDIKHFRGPAITRGTARAIFAPKRHDALWSELKKYAPVAMIKEMGYFDIGMGMSAVEYLQAKEYNGIAEKAKAFFTDSGYRDEALSKGAAVADELTWIEIWKAVKNETAERNPDMDRNSEKFLTIAGDRFAEVIDKTQVYDSVLARSANMRSKSLFMNMATSFMAEPTTTMNMVWDALTKASKGQKKAAARAIASVAMSIIINAALSSFIYAARDDDEDETYLEKYLSRFLSDIMDSFNPITYIPILKDMWSIAQGFDVERADMSLVSDLVDSLKSVVSIYSKYSADMDKEARKEWNRSLAKAWADSAGVVLNLFGVPARNMAREVNGMVNMFTTLRDDIGGRKTTWRSLGDVVGAELRSSIPILGWIPGRSKADKLFDAIHAGDQAYADRLIASYGTEKKAQTAICGAIKERYLAGDIDKKTARDYLTKYGGRSIKEAYFDMKEWDAGENIGMYDDVYKAALAGEDIGAAVDELVEHGEKTEKEIMSQLKSQIKKWYTDPESDTKITREQAQEMVDSYLGLDPEESAALVEEWTFELENGYGLDDIRQTYLDEEITAEEAIAVLMGRKGDTQEEADRKIAEWDFEKTYDFPYSDRRQGYADGKISSSDLMREMMDISGISREQAKDYLRAYEWMKKNPKYDLSVDEALAYTKPVEGIGKSISETGIRPNVFLDYRSRAAKCKGTDDDGDGKTDSGSKKKQVLEVINKMPISPEQKDALYFLNGWAESMLWQAPWHK